MTAVVSTPREQRHFFAQNFKGLITDVVEGADRIYLLSFVSERGQDERFVDPIDGELLVALQFFDSEPAARRWVARDIALRGAQR